jgi:hypothetical protein
MQVFPICQLLVMADRCAAYGKESCAISVRSGTPSEKISLSDPTQASRQLKQSPVPPNPYETTFSLDFKFYASCWKEHISKRTDFVAMNLVKELEKTVNLITRVTAAS